MTKAGSGDNAGFVVWRQNGGAFFEVTGDLFADRLDDWILVEPPCFESSRHSSTSSMKRLSAMRKIGAFEFCLFLTLTTVVCEPQRSGFRFRRLQFSAC